VETKIPQGESYRVYKSISNYSPKFKQCYEAKPKAFNKMRGEFSYVYDISNNHKFIKKNLWK